MILSRSLNEQSQLNLAYSRRISRPIYNQLAPFVLFFDPNTFISGNANLQPAISNNLRISYNIKSYQLSLSYTHTNDAIAQFQPSVVPEENILLLQSENLDKRETFNASLTIPVTVTKHWNMYNNFIATHQSVTSSYTGEAISTSQVSWRINSLQSIRLPKNYKLEVSGFYQSPVLFGVAQIKSYGALNVGISKKFKDDKGTLSLNAENILNSAGWRTQAFFPEQHLDMTGEFIFGYRTIKLSFSNSFGNSKIKKRQGRKTGSEDERKRVE